MKMTKTLPKTEESDVYTVISALALAGLAAMAAGRLVLVVKSRMNYRRLRKDMWEQKL